MSASKTIALLGADVPWAPATGKLGARPVLHDEASGVTVHPGRMLGIVSEDPDASAALADRLRGAGRLHAHRVYPGMSHLFFGFSRTVDRALECVRDIADFLRRQLAD